MLLAALRWLRAGTVAAGFASCALAASLREDPQAQEEKPCLRTFRDRLSDFWMASGPPLVPEPPFEAGACHGARGAIFHVAVSDALAGEGLRLHEYLRRAWGVSALLSGDVKDIFSKRAAMLIAQSFNLCVPAHCTRPSAAMLLAAIGLSVGSCVHSGTELLTLGREFLDNPVTHMDVVALNSAVDVKLLSPQPQNGAEDRVTKISTGFHMPMLAFGTGGLAEGTAELVGAALDAGFRAMDTATHPSGGEGFAYDQPGLGVALALSAARRADIFITSKIHPADFGYLRTLDAAQRCVEELGEGGQGYVDLLLLHFPTCDREYCVPGGRLRPLGDFIDAWMGLEEAVERGLVRHLGVSNFDAAQLEQLLLAARVAPRVAGVWADIFRPIPRALRRLCDKRGMQLQVFGTLGYEWSQGRGKKGRAAPRSSPLLDHPLVRAIAVARGFSAAEVCIKFFLGQGVAVITGTRSLERVPLAAAAGDARALSTDDVEALRDLEGYLDSSLRVSASQDYFQGMLGLDTFALHAYASAAPAEWSCEAAREHYHRDGVVHLRHVLAEAVLASARRAVTRLMVDNGGGPDIEDPAAFPKELSGLKDFGFGWQDTTFRAHIFPLVASLRQLAACFLTTENVVISYIALRAKQPGNASFHFSWHQDMSYLLQAATRARTYGDAKSELDNYSDRNLALHIPLAAETRANGALMYAKGSQRDGVDRKHWPHMWRVVDDYGFEGSTPVSSAFDEHSPGVDTFETNPRDVLVHSILTHHGTHPNLSPKVRWHVEVGIAAGDAHNHWSHRRAQLPADGSLQELLHWLQELSRFEMEEQKELA